MSLLDECIAEAYVSAPQDTIILHTLEINHKSFTEPARVVRWPVTDNEPTVFNCLLEEDAPYNPGQVVKFLGFPLDIVTPEKSTENPGQFQIKISSVGDALDEHLKGAALSGGQITAIYREFIKGSEGTYGPRAVPWHINIDSPKMEVDTIVITGAVLDWMQRVVSYLYTPENSPALVSGG